MDTILLPSIDADARMSDAIDILKKSKTTALVTEQPSGFKVIDIDLILHTLRGRGNVKVKAVKPRLRVLRSPTGKPANKLSNVEMLDAQDLLDKQSAAYAVTRIVRGKAELLTRHESYRYLCMGDPTVWRCRADAQHVWLTNDLAAGNRCRYDGSPVDKV